MDLSLDIYGLVIGLQQLQRVLQYRRADLMHQAKMENVHGLDYIRRLVGKFGSYSDGQVGSMKEQLESELYHRLDRASKEY